MKESRDHHSLAFVRSIISIFYHNSFILPCLGPVIPLVPTLHGCGSVPTPDCGFVVAESSVTTKVAVPDDRQGSMRAMDILVFNDDELQRLDCYQRMDESNDEDFFVSSQKGAKIIMFYANSQHSVEDWMWIGSLSGVSDVSVSLEKESRDFPVMSGRLDVTAGGTYTPTLERLSAEIVLKSVSCNFAGKPYDGEKLENVSVYLTNVNAESPVWPDGQKSSRFINQGRLSENDMSRFSDPSLVFHSLEGSIGEVPVNAGIRLRCYPNSSAKEGPGTPFTRLVIQGDIQGVTWYWPVAVRGRPDEEKSAGVERNTQYTYDILITGKGSADPDTEIEKGSIMIKTEILEWTGKEEYSVQF